MKLLKQLSALTLALAMVFSLLCSAAWAEESVVDIPDALPAAAEPAEEAPEEAPVEEPFVEETTENPYSPAETEEVSVEEAAVEEADGEQSPPPAAEDAAVDEDVDSDPMPLAPSAEDTVPDPVEAPSSRTSAQRTLLYDDRVKLSEFIKQYDGYTYQTISNQQPESYQVERGEVKTVLDEETDTETMLADKAVLSEKNGVLTAVGVGTADLTLTKGKDTLTVTVTVKKAPLTLMFLTGQSNMEGSCPKASTYLPQDSIVCEEGQVYSTYLPSITTRSVRVSGLEEHIADGTLKHVAGSLTGKQNVIGEPLTYPLNALSAKGKGKTGPDSGLAYQWHKDTGDKVWVVNAAYGGSYSSTWAEGGARYRNAKLVFEAALKTANAEVAAGHYTISHKLVFWLQGEADWKNTNIQTSEKYWENFQSFYNGMQNIVSPEYFGIITVRAHFGNDRDTNETTMNSVRTVQYYAARCQELPNVFIVSNVNELWVSDNGVKNYFAKAYPKGVLSYPTHSTKPKLPTKLDDVHPNIHYMQVGHNENGLTAAKGMLNVVRKKGTPSSAIFRNYAGNSLTTLPLNKGKTAIVVVEAAPLSAGKGITLSYDTSAISYDGPSATLKLLKDGTYTVKAMYGSKTLATLTVKQPPTTPTLKSVANTSAGVVVTWSKADRTKGYNIYRKTGSGSYTKIGSTTSTSYTDKKAAKDKTYTYSVRAYNGSLLSGYAPEKTIHRLTAVKISSLKNVKRKKMVVRWAKNTKATGYQVQYSTDSKFQKDVKTTDIGKAKTSSLTVSKLTKKKTYYVRIRTYKKLNSACYYSNWSKASKVSIKK